jgi:hypothetical protein
VLGSAEEFSVGWEGWEGWEGWAGWEGWEGWEPSVDVELVEDCG